MSELHRSTPPRRPLTRRTVLRGMAGLGAVAATGRPRRGLRRLAPPARRRRSAPRPRRRAPLPPRCDAGPVSRAHARSRTPEDELFVYNWADYIGEDTIAVVRGQVRDQGHLRLLRQRTTTMTAKISTGNSGYDVTFPTSINVPGLPRRAT